MTISLWRQVSRRGPTRPQACCGSQWRRSIFDFYTFDGAQALAEALRRFGGGRFVVHITDMPIKCPVAPLEFTLLADAYFRRRGIRDRVEMAYVTPLSGAFTKPISSTHLGSMLARRNVSVESYFLVERIDPQTKTLVSYDERAIPFDLLVTVPLNIGADLIARFGLGDELNYVPVDKHAPLAEVSEHFAVGDACDIPASKAGSVARFAVGCSSRTSSRTSTASRSPVFDGHASCFIESGDGKGPLIDFARGFDADSGRCGAVEVGLV